MEKIKKLISDFKQTRFWQYKFAMVLTAVSLLLLVFFYTGLRSMLGHIFSPRLGTSSQLASGGVAIENSTWRDEFPDGRVLEIASQLIQTKNRERDIIYMQDMNGRMIRPLQPQTTPDNGNAASKKNSDTTPPDYSSPDGILFTFKTPSGILTVSKSSLLLDKDVVMTMASGLVMNTRMVVIDMKKSEMIGHEPVKGIGPNQQFEAEGIAITEKGNRIKLLGQSHLVIMPGGKK